MRTYTVTLTEGWDEAAKTEKTRVVELAGMRHHRFESVAGLGNRDAKAFLIIHNGLHDYNSGRTMHAFDASNVEEFGYTTADTADE